MRLHAPLAAIALAALVTMPALGAAPTGRWDYLGEDGAVFVPFDAPEATVLPAPDLGAYHNATEAVAAFQALATARPDLVSLRVGGTSVQGRPVLVATITAPGDATGRARVLFDAAHHGDEVISAEILVRFAQRIAAEYDTNATMRDQLSRVVVDIVPMVNPDGVALVPQCTNYANCRKNAHGVDLNRNYPAHWGEPGASGNPSDATYRGPSPASEPETRVIQGLLDENDYALYASLHSGAEMILWPWGWTTTPPPEASVYQTLGNELTAITGAPNGQVSRILYGVSGDSMDQAYGSAAGWRALAISPETYEGSGNAFDWWLLFNPPETEASIAPTVARWDRFLWHMVKEAPGYAPATLTAPESVSLGPDVGDISYVVTGPSRRPLSGSLRLEAPDVLDVLSPNPVAITGSGAGTFSALPLRGGAFDATLRLDAGPAGNVTREVALALSQVGMDLALDKGTMESPDANVARVTMDVGPYDGLVGNVTVSLGATTLGAATFTAAPGAPATLAFAFDGVALPGGMHAVTARATFTADDDGTPRAGMLTDAESLLVLRPQITLDKRFVAQSKTGDALAITALYRNTGTFVARDVVIEETVPAGYAYWFRDGPVPLPTDPLGKPQPTGVSVQPDGSVRLTWSFGNVAPGAMKFAQYRLLALAPGVHTLPSAWSYVGDFDSGTVTYAESAAPAHGVVEAETTGTGARPGGGWGPGLWPSMPLSLARALIRRNPRARRVRVFLALPATLDPAIRRAIEETLPPKHTAMPPLPDAHAGIAQSERNRFLVAIDQMMEADLLIAEASAPDAAGGWCLAWFLARGRLAIVCCKRDARPSLTPMLAGNPSPWQRLILYETPAELQLALRGLLS